MSLTFELFGDEIPREGDESLDISWFNGDRRLTPAPPHPDAPCRQLQRPQSLQRLAKSRKR